MKLEGLLKVKMRAKYVIYCDPFLLTCRFKKSPWSLEKCKSGLFTFRENKIDKYPDIKVNESVPS